MPSYCKEFKNKISKQENFKRLEEAGGDFSVSTNIGFHFQLLLGKKKIDSDKSGKYIHQKIRQPVPRGKEKNSPGLGRQFAFVFEM